jgi:hypothetical protein
MNTTIKKPKPRFEDLDHEIQVTKKLYNKDDQNHYVGIELFKVECACGWKSFGHLLNESLAQSFGESHKSRTPVGIAE